MGKYSSSYHSLVTQAAEYGDKLFSGSNLSQVDFANKLKQFNSFITSFGQTGIEQASSRNLIEAYNQVCKAIS